MAALQYLESLRNAHPELSDWCNVLADLYQKKLWHQLTQHLELFLMHPIFKFGDSMIQLYNNFITDFETKINLLELADFAILVSRQYTEKEAAISYLERVIEKIRATQEKRVEEPILYIKIQLGVYRLENGEPKECKKLLDDGETVLENMTDIVPWVYFGYYWLSLRYYKSLQEFTDFYNNALLFIAYTSLDSLTASHKKELAFELSISALLGDNIYDFGELLVHPVLSSLLGTEGAWLYHILYAVNYGFVISHHVALVAKLVCARTRPPLLGAHAAAHQKKLIVKIYALCVMGVISRRPPNEPTVPLSEIAKWTQLPLKDNELLLMNCLSVHLIEGKIDQGDDTFYVSWVRPRVLRIPQVKAMRRRLDEWMKKVNEGYMVVKKAVEEGETPDRAGCWPACKPPNQKGMNDRSSKED